MSKNNTIDVSALPKETSNNKPLQKILSKQQQIKLSDMFDESELQHYFLSAQGKIPYETLQLAGMLYAEEGTAKVHEQIIFGDIQVKDQKQVLDREFLKEKISIQEQKAMNLRLKKAEIEQRLKYLQLQTSNHSSILQNSRKIDNNPELGDQFRPPNVLSKEQHQLYVQKIMKSRLQRDKKHKKIIQTLQNSIKQEEQKQKIQKTQKLIKQKQKRRINIQKSLQMRKQVHEKYLQQQMKSRQQYKKAKNKSFLHEKLQLKYQSEVQAPALQQKKKKLKQIRDMSKAFDVQQILKHQRQYTQRRNQSLSMVKSKADDWNYKPPQKQQRLIQIIQNQKIQQRKKLQQKKRQIQQKIQKQSQYVEYLKQRFEPKIDQSKQRQIQQRLINISKPKRRQSALDAKVLGISYLQHVKKLKKQKTQSQRPLTQKNSEVSLQKASQKGTTDYLSANRKQKQYYQQKRRKRLQNLIQSSKPTDEKIKKLKQQTQKIGQAYSRKQAIAKLKHQDIHDEQQALQLLLSGIKAKMGIISVYKNKQTI